MILINLLPNLFTYFFLDFLGFSLIHKQLCCLPSISFTCLIAMAGMSSIILTEVVEAYLLILLLVLGDLCSIFTVEYDVKF